MDPKADSIRQENESANWKIGQWKFSSLKNRKKKDLRKSEHSLRDLWTTIRRTKTSYGGPRGGDREEGRENI